MVIQAVELILALLQAFNVLSTPMLIISSSFHIFLEKPQPALFNCVALGALKSFEKFTGKHLWWSLSFDKLANYTLAALLKKKLQHKCFHVNFTKFLWTTFSQNENKCFCNKTSAETSFKNDGWWVPWFEHRGNSFTSFRSIKLFFLFLLFISLFSWHFDFC